jgi:hypothetical protein
MAENKKTFLLRTPVRLKLFYNHHYFLDIQDLEEVS